MALALLTEPNNLTLYGYRIQVDTLQAQNIEFSGTEIENLQIENTLTVGDVPKGTSGKIIMRGGVSGQITMEILDDGPTDYKIVLPSTQPDLNQVLTIESYDNITDRYITSWTDKTQLPSQIDFLTIGDTLRVGTLPNTGKLQLDSETGETLILTASSNATESYTIELPSVKPLVGQILMVVFENDTEFICNWVSPPTSFENLTISNTTNTGKVNLSTSGVSLESQISGESYALEMPAVLPTLNQVMAVTSNNDSKYQLSFVDKLPSQIDFLTIGDTLRIGSLPNTGKLQFDSETGETLILTASTTATESYTIELPAVKPLVGQILMVVSDNTNKFLCDWVSPPTSFENLNISDTTYTTKINLTSSSVSLESQVSGQTYSLQMPAVLPALNQVLSVTSNNDSKYQMSFVDQPATSTYIYPNIQYINVDQNLINLTATPISVLAVSITPKFINSKFKISFSIYSSLVKKTVDFNTDAGVFYTVYKNSVAETSNSQARSAYGFGSGTVVGIPNINAPYYFGPTISFTRIFEGIGSLSPILWEIFGFTTANSEGSFLIGNLIVEEIYIQP